MQERLLGSLGALALSRPYAVLAFAALAALGSAAGLGSLEIASSRFALIDPDGRVEAALARYGAQGDLVVAITSGDAASGRAAAEAIGAHFEGRAWYRIDPALARGRELDRVPPGRLARLVEASRPGGPRALTEVLDEALGRLRPDETVTLETLDDDAAGADPAALAELDALLRALLGWLEAPGGRLFPAPASAPVDEAGYLVSDDGRTRYAFIAPRSTEAGRSTDRYEDVAPWVERARAAARQIEASHPGVSIALTGYPALAVEEVEAIRSGSALTGAAALLIVVGLFAVGFRSRGALVVAGVPLLLGMAWAFGLIALSVGRLNLLTQAAAPVFAGLGIDFSVHLVAAYERARADDLAHRDAALTALRDSGRAIVTGGLTTAGAFFALTLTRAEALVELGWIAGAGLLLVMLAVLLVTPALWTVAEQRSWRWMRVRARPEPAASARLAETVTRHPRLWLGLGVGLTALLAVGVGRVGFDPDVEALLPADAPSVVAARRMSEGSAFSSEVLLAEREDLRALRATAARLEALPSVARVESLAAFVPEDVRAQRAILAAARALPDAPGSPPRPSRAAEVDRQLDALARELEGASREVRQLASREVARGLAATAETARGVRARLARHRGPDAALASFDAALARELEEARALVARADLDAPPSSAADLPRALRDRLVARDPGGEPRYALYVRPTEGVFAPGALDTFVEEVQGVAPDVVGYPIALRAFFRDTRRSIETAAAVAALLLLAILALDFRRPREVFLALVPVALGASWLLGALGWLGIDLNPANLAALPLVLGVGVDDGVHLVHQRQRHLRTAPALASIARALVLTTATTLAGFGTLGLAAHRGMQSFGLVMGIGAVSCLLATLFVLPPLLCLAHREGAVTRAAATDAEDLA